MFAHVMADQTNVTRNEACCDGLLAAAQISRSAWVPIKAHLLDLRPGPVKSFACDCTP
jgi:hypothetical protein